MADTKKKKPVILIFGLLSLLGIVAFIKEVTGEHPQNGWLAYHTNLLFFSALAHGGLVFSTLMHVTRAKWSGPISNLAESFTFFFPVSFILFFILFAGKTNVFPWIGQDLHGKEVWLNLPFLFGRDISGLFILYLFGFLYLFSSLRVKLDTKKPESKIHNFLSKRWEKNPQDIQKLKYRTTVYACLYMLLFTVILSLLGYDLIMSMDPHWYSTLFGAYSFIKSVYSGFGALIIITAVLHISSGNTFKIRSSQLHDISMLFFAFCLVWADFFYSQFIVLWYGNISEETAYIIERTMIRPWSYLAWSVFIVCFIMPFLVLINQKIKKIPVAMIIICGLVVTGIWVEHYLLIGPAYPHKTNSLPFGIVDVLIALGFIGLMALSLTFYFRQFPELLKVEPAESK